MASGLDEATIKKNAIHYWQQGPLNAPVKVTSVSRHPTFWTEGYITCRKFIAGRTLQEAERILGLRPNELANGAYVYEFVRLPKVDEFELRGYTQTPGGQPWHPASDQPARRHGAARAAPAVNRVKTCKPVLRCGGLQR